MKKSMLLLSILAGSVALLGTACSHVEASKVGEQVAIKMPVMIKTDVQTKNEKINGSATVHSILGIISWGPSKQAIGVNYFAGEQRTDGGIGQIFSLAARSEAVARNAAAYEATSKAKADIILAPQFILTTKDYIVYKSIKCDVTGFPGFIQGVKVVDEK